MEPVNVILTTMAQIAQVSYQLSSFDLQYSIKIFIFYDQSIARALQHAKEKVIVIHLEIVYVIVVTLEVIVNVSPFYINVMNFELYVFLYFPRL